MSSLSSALIAVFGSETPLLHFSMSVTDLFSTIRVRKYVPYDPKDVFYLPDKAGGISQRAKNQYHLLGAVGAGHRIQLERIRFCQAGAFAENPLCRRSDAGEAPQLLAKSTCRTVCTPTCSGRQRRRTSAVST